MLWVSEHGKIASGSTNKILPDGRLQLCESDFGSLLTLLDTSADQQAEYGAFFKYGRSSGRDQLTVQNYAGIIALESGVQIELLPKLSRADGPEIARSLLVKMLMSLFESPFKPGSSASLNAHKMPLFEILMRDFLEHVSDIVRKGVARDYQSYEGNLIFLRGKLKISEQIKRNSARQDRVYCEYDEYEANRPINRLIRRALDTVGVLTKDIANQQLCRELSFWFDSVPPSNSIDRDWSTIRQDRMIRHYEPAMPACMMILHGLNPLTQQGARKSTSLLFPMERVFECYVADKLIDQLPFWKVSTQHSGKSLIENHRGGRKFGLRPDLFLSRGQSRVVADTKWKLINGSDRKSNYSIKQSDVYQMFAYSRKFLRNQPIRETYLIYPKHTLFSRPLRPFWYREEEEVLYVVPYDIENELLVFPGDCALEKTEQKMQTSGGHGHV